MPTASLLKFPWRIVTAIVVVAAVTAVLAATRADYSANRQRIADMPERDRQRLEHNFADFEQLAPEQQDRLRQLHEQIAAQGLQSELDEYVKWSATLGPGQRDELRKEPDPRKRAAHVEDFVAEQESEKQKRRVGSLVSGGFRRFNLPPLSPDDLEAIAGVLIETLPTSTTQAKAALRKKALFEQYLEIYKPLNRRLSLPPGQRTATASWPDAETVDQAVDQIASSERRDFLNFHDKGLESKSPAERQRARDDKRRSLMYSVGWALLREIESERRKHRPDDETLRSYFDALPPAEADELMKMRPEDAKERLANKYRDAHPLPELTAAEELKNAVDEYRRQLFSQRLMPPFDFNSRRSGPFGGSPPKSGPPPDQRSDQRGFGNHP